MSGGSFEYGFARIYDMADRLDAYRTNNEFSDATELDRAKLAAFALYLRAVASVMHDVEWWVSGDYGRERGMKSVDAFLVEVCAAMVSEGKKESALPLACKEREELEDLRVEIRALRQYAKELK